MVNPRRYIENGEQNQEKVTREDGSTPHRDKSASNNIAHSVGLPVQHTDFQLYYQTIVA